MSRPGRRVRDFLEDHLPFRLQWIAKLVFVRPLYWFAIFRRLDYGSMLRRDKSTANVNNTIVKGMILGLYGPKLLETVLEAGRALDMRLFLTYGTLLGHFRDGGFIKHDWDIDLGILQDDIPKMEMLKKAVEARGYPVARESRHRMAFRDHHNLIHLDIDYYFNQGDKLVHYVYNVGKCELYTFSYPRDVLSTFREVKFLGTITALVPVDSERFLFETYGDWRTPKQDQRPSDFPNVTIRRIEPLEVPQYMPFTLSQS